LVGCWAEYLVVWKVVDWVECLGDKKVEMRVAYWAVHWVASSVEMWADKLAVH